jgi:uncharacterized repeat protein (TIGR01451 family)
MNYRKGTAVRAVVAAFVVFFVMTVSGMTVYAVDSSFTQCANDPDNSGLVEMCQWVTGALVTSNSRYAESDGVPQRWFFEHVPDASPDTHTATFKYAFTKSSIYAFDFLTDVDHTMPMSLINPCGDLPPFVSPADCVNAFGASVPVQIQSDPFDAVSSREHPPMRYALFGCYDLTANTACTVTDVHLDAPVHDPTTTCFQTCGNSDASVTIHFTTSGGIGDTLLISFYFSGQLASAADPDGVGPAIGWGTGFGSSSISGSPFHLSLVNIDGDTSGARDNQINAGVIRAAHDADLSVTKSCPDTVHAGNNVSYTITVANDGPETATGVYIDDTLPLQTNVTFVSAMTSRGTCDAAPVGTNLHCDIGFMQPHDTATITIVVNVSSAFSGSSITDSVTVGGAPADPDTSDNTASCTTDVLPPVGPPIDLSVSKTCPTGPFIAGVPTDLTYNITVANNDSTNAATGVTLTDSLPAGVTFDHATPSQGSCSESAGVVTCLLGSIGHGANATVTIVAAEPTDPSFRGDLTNIATVSGDQSDNITANNTSSCTNTVTGQKDISIVKTCPSSEAEGNLITYHITATNAGPSTSLDTHVEDILPNISDVLQVSFVSATPSQGSCTFIMPDIVHCTLGDILPSNSATIDIVVQSNNGTAGSTLTNIAKSHIHPPDEDTNHCNDTPDYDDCEPNCPDCSCSTGITSPPSLDLQVTKNESPDPVLAGENLTYTMVVTSNSVTTDDTLVTLDDTLPGGVTFVSATTTQGSCSNNGNVSVHCDLGTLSANPPNASNPVTVTIVVTVNPSTTGTLTNTAVVAGHETESDAGPPDANNTATTVTQVNSGVGLFITKQDAPDPVVTGNNLTYTIVAGNVGPSDATNVQVVDTLPPGAVSFITAIPSQGSCTNNGNISVTCNLGTIAAGNSVTIIIRVKVTIAVSPGESTIITNHVNVRSTEDPTDANSRADTTVINRIRVPALSDWGMLIFFVLAGVASVYYLKRQRRT